MRHRAIRRVSIGMVAGTVWWATVLGTAAQSNAGCPLPPLELPLFDATPAAEIVVATPGVAEPPSDEEIVEAAGIIVDCISTNDATYRYAVFTDRYLASQFTEAGGSYQPAFELELARRSLGQPVPFSLVAVEEITPLDDGRVGVRLVLASPTAEFADRLILAKQGEFWLIDEVVELDPPR